MSKRPPVSRDPLNAKREQIPRIHTGQNGTAEPPSPRFSPFGPGKFILLIWLVIGGAYWITRMATRPVLGKYLTYWSFVLELVILVYIFAWEFAFFLDKRAVFGPELAAENKMAQTKVQQNMPQFATTLLRASRYQRFRREVVVLIGTFIGTATMVFTGSVYISVDAAVSLAPLIATDSTMPISNLITHTLPFVVSIVLVCTYSQELRLSLTHARWLVWFAWRKDGADVFPEERDGYREEQWRRVRFEAVDVRGATEQFTVTARDEAPFDWRTANWERFAMSKYPTLNRRSITPPPNWLVSMGRWQRTRKIFLDMAHFWFPIVVPLIWRLLCSPEETYEITTSVAMYMFVATALLGPSIILAFMARLSTLNDPVLGLEWHKERMEAAVATRQRAHKRTGKNINKSTGVRR
jgi:hypothetical protein